MTETVIVGFVDDEGSVTAPLDVARAESLRAVVLRAGIEMLDGVRMFRDGLNADRQGPQRRRKAS